jgi:hypothetical protein
MEFILEQAVQRMQNMAINPPTTPCPIPQERATSSTAVDASSKGLTTHFNHVLLINIDVMKIVIYTLQYILYCMCS